MLRIMGLQAIALLRLSASDLPEGAVERALGDAVLVKAGVTFVSEPDQLARALRRVAGDALDRHRDPRGVLLMPDVARPQGTTYDAIVEEVGEGGTWISLDEEEDDDDAGDGDLLATMMQAMASPGMQDVLSKARDAMMGGEGAPGADRMMELARSMSQGITAGPGGQAERDMRAMVERHAGSVVDDADDGGMPMDLGALMSDPVFQQMVDGVRQQLLSDPGKMAELQALLERAADEEEDDDEPT